MVESMPGDGDSCSVLLCAEHHFPRAMESKHVKQKLVIYKDEETSTKIGMNIRNSFQKKKNNTKHTKLRTVYKYL